MAASLLSVAVLALAAARPPRPGAAGAHGRLVARPRRTPPSMDVDAAKTGFFERARPRSGPEAFEGTVWSVLMQMLVGGGQMFTVEMLDAGKCRFSDTDKIGPRALACARARSRRAA